MCEVFDIIAREGNVEDLTAEARTGIVKGAAVDLQDDPEDFEDPDQNFIPPMLRKHMAQLSAEELAQYKSRGQDVFDYLRK
jgi:hypothetical protein